MALLTLQYLHSSPSPNRRPRNARPRSSERSKQGHLSDEKIQGVEMIDASGRVHHGPSSQRIREEESCQVPQMAEELSGYETWMKNSITCMLRGCDAKRIAGYTRMSGYDDGWRRRGNMSRTGFCDGRQKQMLLLELSDATSLTGCLLLRNLVWGDLITTDHQKVPSIGACQLLSRTLLDLPILHSSHLPRCHWKVRRGTTTTLQQMLRVRPRCLGIAERLHSKT